MSPTQTREDLGAEQVNELARMFWYSAIFRAGIKLDVFSYLENHRATSPHSGLINDIAIYLEPYGSQVRII